MLPTEFPRQLGSKLKRLREHRRLSPDELAPRVSLQSGAEVLSYENDEGELPVSVLFAYAKEFGIPFENIVNDRRDVWLGHRQN
jgi:transcriptional regulator with XRE-family HTH domain